VKDGRSAMFLSGDKSGNAYALICPSFKPW
jgi:hypothetical protein